MYSGIAKEYKGAKLYKYYSYNDCTSKMFAPLQNNTLRFRSPFSFNDPYDCYIAMNNNNKSESIHKSMMKDMKVCSLTTTPDNMLMWSHYASSHRGFILEYDLEKLKNISSLRMVRFSNMEAFSYVEYSDEIIARNMLKENFNNEEGEKKIVQAIFHKPLCWQYENEVRSVVYGAVGNKLFMDIELFDDSITAVILGSHFSSNCKDYPLEILNSWAEQGKLYYMQLCSDKYKLEKKPLDLEGLKGVLINCDLQSSNR